MTFNHQPAHLEAAQTAVAEAVHRFHPRLKLACSFSPEDIVVAHLLAAATPEPRVFAIDTGRLPEETHECAEQVRRRLGIEIEWYLPDAAAVEALVRTQGTYSFRESLEARHACCAVRKLEPLARALRDVDAWLTGLRAEQSVTRTAVEIWERDAERGLWKINPLAAWTMKDVWRYVHAHRLPYNRLFDQGYTSLGCAPCTRPITPGEDSRAGRWWWENPEHRECGLHPTPKRKENHT